MTMISSVGPSVGYDHGSAVSDRYRGPFPFEGTLERLDIEVLSSTAADQRTGGAADGRAAMARQ